MNKIDEKFFAGILSDEPELIEESLIEGANPFETYGGVSPLALALNKGKLEAFKYLLEVTKGGKELDKNEDLGSDTLLTRLLRDPFMNPSFPLALIEAGADVNLTNKRGEDPLTLAVNFEKVEEVKALLDAGANIDYVEPTLKTTPFLTAARIGNKYVLQAMIEKGVDVNKVNAYGLNALDLVSAKYTMKMTKEEKEEFFELFKYMVESGVNVNNVAKSGLTPLWSVAFMNKEMDLLVQAGADIYAEHERGMSKRESFAHFALSNLPEMLVKVEKDGKKEKTIKTDFSPLLRAKIFEKFKYGYKNSYGNTLEGLLALNTLSKEENLIKSFGVYVNADLNQMVYPQGKEVKSNKKESANIPMIYGIVSQLPEDMLIALMQMKKQKGEDINWLFINNKEVLPQAQPINAFISSGKLKALRFAAELTGTQPEMWEVTNKIGQKLSAQDLLSKILYLPNLDNLEAEKKKYDNILKAIETNKANNVQSDVLTPEAIKEVEVRSRQLAKNIGTLEKYQEEVGNNLKHIGFKFNGKDNNDTPYVFNVEYFQVLKVFEKFGADLKDVDAKGNNIVVNAILKLYPIETIANLGLAFNKDEDFWNGVWNQLAYHDIGQSLVQKSIESMFMNLGYVFQPELKEGEKFILPGVNHKDEDGNTPLMTALANGYPYYASLVINNGANVNEANNEGETPLMYAVSLEHEDIFRKLLENGADITSKTKEGLSVQDLVEDIEDEHFAEVVESAIQENLAEKKKVIFKK